MIKRIPLSQVHPNADQPRKLFTADALTELADSIEQNGLLQPITVIKTGPKAYKIVAGERRWRAHMLLAERGGAETIQAIVQDFDDEQVDVNAIIENDCRSDTTPLEQARAYQRMIDLYGFTAETLGKKLGKAPHRIEERLRLLMLTPECQ
jgi:ParB family chromosome partitioning protein